MMLERFLMAASSKNNKSIVTMKQSALLSLTTHALKEGGDLRKITMKMHPKRKDLRNRVTSR